MTSYALNQQFTGFQNRELLEVFERTARPGLLGPVRYGSLFFNKRVSLRVGL
jgi:hypothetical protein